MRFRTRLLLLCLATGFGLCPSTWGVPILTMTRTVEPDGVYIPAAPLDVTVNLDFNDEGTLTALGLEETLPAGWTYDSVVAGDEPSIAPPAGWSGLLDFSWYPLPVFPASFTYRVNVPEGEEELWQITGEAYCRVLGVGLVGSGEVTTDLTLPGSLQVTIEPAGARTAGAQWAVDAGDWQDSDAVVNDLFAGEHLVSFSNVAGWDAPNDVLATIVPYQVATLTAVYAETGSAPPNDNFADSLDVGVVAIETERMLVCTNMGATSEPEEPTHAGVGGGASIWWHWTFESDKYPYLATLDTLDSDFDTVLAVYTGDTLSLLTAVAGNDDCEGTDEGSCVSFEPTDGETYRIAVDGKAVDKTAEQGPIVLSILLEDLGGEGECEVCASADVLKPIEDNNTIASTLTFPESRTINDLNVMVNLTHEYDEELTVTLESPEGTSALLFTAVGGSGRNFLGTELDDEALVSISSGTAPFLGRYVPMGNLSAFDGENAHGTWVLRICDSGSGNTGMLFGWSILIGCDTRPGGDPYHSADTNRDGVIAATEIGRVVAFYNAGGYHRNAHTSDGYAPGEGPREAPYHHSDYNPEDWQISAVELGRLVTFYNAGGYCRDPGTQDGFAPTTTRSP